jgi:hypothetical protein
MAAICVGSIRSALASGKTDGNFLSGTCAGTMKSLMRIFALETNREKIKEQFCSKNEEVVLNVARSRRWKSIDTLLPAS